MKTKASDILRWVVVLPAAIGSALLAEFPIHWMVMLIHSNPEGENSPTLSAIEPRTLEYFGYFGYALFTPLTMIWVGVIVAPKFKFETGIALAVLWGILFGAAVAFGISRGILQDYGWVRFLVTAALGVLGTVSGLYQARKLSSSTK